MTYKRLGIAGFSPVCDGIRGVRLDFITSDLFSYRDMYPDKESHPGYTNDTPECNWDGVTPAMCSNDKR